MQHDAQPQESGQHELVEKQVGYHERKLFQNAVAETAGNRLRIYRPADPRGLAERQLVAEFAQQDVHTWFAMADARL
jgi:hypothetical protein